MIEKSIEISKNTQDFDDLIDESGRTAAVADVVVVVIDVVFRFSTCKTSGKNDAIDKNRQNLWRETRGKKT